MAALNFKRLAGAVTGKALPAAAGGALSLAANKLIPASVNPKLSAGLKILAGALIPELMPKMKALEFVGIGMCGQAGAELAAEFIPSIAGTDDEIEGVGAQQEYIIDKDFVEGVDDEGVEGVDDPMVAGGDNDPQVNGYGDDLYPEDN